jgi:hypothetical protein
MNTILRIWAATASRPLTCAPGQMDYGAAAANYIDAFFNNINWDAVAQRV